MFKNLNCLIGLSNSDNSVIFKFWNSKVELKNSNARKFLNSRPLKSYKAHHLKNSKNYLGAKFCTKFLALMPKFGSINFSSNNFTKIISEIKIK